MGWQALVRRRTNKSALLKCVHLASSLVILFNLLAIGSGQQDDVAKSGNKSELPGQVGSEPSDEAQAKPVALSLAQAEKEAFVVELLKELHEQYGSGATTSLQQPSDLMQERRSYGASPLQARMLPSLLEAIGAEGDVRRLIDWVKDSFEPSHIPEVTTQFVVSKLGAVNCPALLRADKEDSLIPRFLLFNEHHLDVPFELPIKPSPADCLKSAKFDPARKTVIIIHGYLGGYTLIDGLTNIKNRLLDLNQWANEQAINTFLRSSKAANSSYVFTEDLSAKIRSQLYNVIIVDWFNGANPSPRASYIRAAVNAQVVGKLIARFLSALVVQCGTAAERLQIIAHSLGCHVSGFTGKAMNAAGHRLGKITHLDPVGLCFGRLFSRPHFRLAPNDALETQAVHVSLNVFDNPLDGAHSNFLLNGGRDQPGCGSQNEVSNSTISSVSLLWDPAARFAPCSHMRALALLEDDLSSGSDQCQLVGYRCSNYDRFLAGKCGFCDASNAQCRLMGLAPISLKFRSITLAKYHYDDGPLVEPLSKHFATYSWRDLHSVGGEQQADHVNSSSNAYLSATTSGTQNSSAAWQPTTGRAGRSSEFRATSSHAPDLVSATTTTTTTTRMYGQPVYRDRLKRRSESRPAGDKRERIANVIEKIRSDTRSIWSGMHQVLPEYAVADEVDHDDEGLNSSPKEADDNQLAANDAVAALNDKASSVSSSTRATLDATPTTATPTTNKVSLAWPPDELTPGRRDHEDGVEQTPLGGQPIPAGSQNGPLFFLGTSSMSPYCVNYYQVRVLIAESRLLRIQSQNGLASNRLQAHYNLGSGSLLKAAVNVPVRGLQSSGRDMLHLTIKLTDSLGHFFKGFSVLENARSLARVMNDFIAPASLMGSASNHQPVPGLNEPMFEVTMLLNSTRAQPSKVAESVISYYFHQLVLADRLEINYMSNISPEIRARYSSVLCPVAINDRHQLVKYVECHKVGRRRRRRRRR